MRSGLHQIRGLLEALAEALDLGPGLRAQRAIAEFGAIVGPGINCHAWAEDVRGDTLLVVTDSPVWSHQLQMLEPELVLKLRNALGPDCPVNRLRFRSGSRRRAFAPREPEDGSAGTSQGGRAKPAKLTRRDWHDIRLAADQAQDDALARALIGVLRAQVTAGEGPPAGPESKPLSSEVEPEKGNVV